MELIISASANKKSGRSQFLSVFMKALSSCGDAAIEACSSGDTEKLRKAMADIADKMADSLENSSEVSS